MFFKVCVCVFSETGHLNRLILKIFLIIQHRISAIMNVHFLFLKNDTLLRTQNQIQHPGLTGKSKIPNNYPHPCSGESSSITYRHIPAPGKHVKKATAKGGGGCNYQILEKARNLYVINYISSSR